MMFQILNRSMAEVVCFSKISLVAVSLFVGLGGQVTEAQTTNDGEEARFAYVGTYTRGFMGDHAPVAGLSICAERNSGLRRRKAR